MLTVLLRTILVYLLVILAVRLMGKRQLGELAPSELVTTILISNLASLPIEETDLPIVGAIAPIFIIVCLEITLSIFEIKFSKVSKIVSGNAKPVIKDGVIVQSVMKELRYSVNDLLEALRNKDIFDITEVEYAVIETNGTLNAYKKHDKQTPTNGDLKIEATGPSRPPVAVVVDGEIQQEALTFCNRDELWLQKQLDDLQVSQKDVLLLQCDMGGNCHAIKRTV